MTRARADVVVATSLFAAAVCWVVLTGERPLLVAVLASAAYTLPLALRHRAPLLTTVLVLGGIGVLVLTDVDGFMLPPVCVALAAFTAGRHLAAPRAEVAAALAVGWLPIIYLIERTGSAEDVLFGALIFGGAWWGGRTLRARAEARDAETAVQEQLREAAERRARDDERARIARELHDVVSHSVSVITIQAESVRRRLLPEQQVEAERLRDIETSARHAMVELRRLLGTLPRGDGPAPLDPQPGLDQLPRLVERTSAAGLPVELEVRGAARPLPAGVDLAAYRVVQEALTNALRHAGPATATVTIDYEPDSIRLSVADTGRGANGSRAGRGLIGMRERVDLFGGTLELRSTAEGSGVSVTATLPTRAGERP